MNESRKDRLTTPAPRCADDKSHIEGNVVLRLDFKLVEECTACKARRQKNRRLKSTNWANVPFGEWQASSWS